VIYWLAERLLDSQEEVGSVQSVAACMSICVSSPKGEFQLLDRSSNATGSEPSRASGVTSPPSTSWRQRRIFYSAKGSIPGMETFSFLHAVQIDSGATGPHIQWVPEAPSPGVKWLGREAHHSPPPSAEVKNGEATPSHPHMSSKPSA
jgi:hypothetical protein